MPHAYRANGPYIILSVLDDAYDIAKLTPERSGRRMQDVQGRRAET